ncbi:VOC family protein [Planococcus sp. 1R117A]|uniref:VOC family protein n=1 Tax=Planococcus sp. 1R117A TaxID=3447020 RepID=UPI003EDBCD0D
MPVHAYMVFNGNCEEAVGYYAEVFGAAKPEIMRFGDMPPEEGFEMDEDMKKLVMHTNLNIMGSEVMFSDAMPNSPVTFGQNFNLTVVSDNMDELKSQFNRLAQDGKVTMDMQETFWSPAYGALEDKFGVAWQFSCDDGSYGQQQ